MDKVYDYTLVMAWYDVREKENNPLRTVNDNKEFCLLDKYIEKSRNLMEKECPLIMFIEPRFEEIFWKIRPAHLHHITRLIPKDFDDLYRYSDLFPKFSENYLKNPVQNLHKEKFTPLYNFVVNQKVEWVREAILWNPFNTERFGWADIRLHDIDMDEFNQIFAHFPEDRVIITQSWYTNPDEVVDRYHWYIGTRGKVCAGFFAGYIKPLLKFCELCRKEFENSINIGCAVTDEMIYSVVVAENLNLFEPHIGDYGDVLHNIICNRNNTWFSVNYLNWAYNNGHHYYTHKICENLRKGIFEHNIGVGQSEIHKIWFYNYVACYWLNKRDTCLEILEEYYDLLLNNEPQRNYVASIWSFFKSMIDYMHNSELMSKYESFFEKIE